MGVVDAESPGNMTFDACWEANSLHPHRQTNTCENITLLQTSFTGGKHIGLNQTKLLQRPTTDLERKLSFSEWNSIEFVEDYF